MALFQRRRYVWNEPWFFQQRIRPMKVWLLFSLLLFAVAVAVGASLLWNAPGGRLANLFEAVGLSIAVAAALWWVLDGTNTRRQAILFDDSIVVGGDMGKYSVPNTYKLSEITGATIVMPEESKWPEPALFFLYEGEEQAIGIDSNAGLRRLAQAIHDAGVPVRLDGWEPDRESEFEKAFSWQADPQDVTEKARMETLPPGTVSMSTVGGEVLGAVRLCWAIALWLAITGYAVYYGYQNWNNLGLVRMVLLFAIPIGTMWIAAQFTERIALASTVRGLIRTARSQMRKRDGIELNADANDLIYVEILDRSQFVKSIKKIRAMGFLQADHSGRRMLFEGRKERWCIPAGAIESLEIEEVQEGTPGQSATGALEYYVVVRFAADEDQEFGFHNGERDFGEFGDVKRAQGAIRLYETFESLRLSTASKD